LKRLESMSAFLTGCKGYFASDSGRRSRSVASGTGFTLDFCFTDCSSIDGVFLGYCVGGRVSHLHMEGHSVGVILSYFCIVGSNVSGGEGYRIYIGARNGMSVYCTAHLKASLEIEDREQS
jgi:hypothetical protein